MLEDMVRPRDWTHRSPRMLHRCVRWSPVWRIWYEMPGVCLSNGQTKSQYRRKLIVALRCSGLCYHLETAKGTITHERLPWIIRLSTKLWSKISKNTLKTNVARKKVTKFLVRNYWQSDSRIVSSFIHAWCSRTRRPHWIDSFRSITLSDQFHLSVHPSQSLIHNP